MCCWHTIQDQTLSHCPGLCVLHYRAQILAKKVSARAFKVVPGKTGEAAGEIGIEGTTIEAPTEASAAAMLMLTLLHCARFRTACETMPFLSAGLFSCAL